MHSRKNKSIKNQFKNHKKSLKTTKKTQFLSIKKHQKTSKNAKKHKMKVKKSTFILLCGKSEIKKSIQKMQPKNIKY